MAGRAPSRPTVVVGEALVDVVHRAGEDTSAEHPGGSPLNVAYGLGRLEHDVALLTGSATTPTASC